MNIITIVIIIIFTCLMFIGFFFRKVSDYTILYTFIFLGIGFFITGVLMIFSIKNNFFEFYQKVSTVLWFATILLSIPMFLRGINWVL